MKAILDVVSDKLFDKREILKTQLEKRDSLCNQLASIQREINLNNEQIKNLEMEHKQLIEQSYGQKYGADMCTDGRPFKAEKSLDKVLMGQTTSIQTREG